MRIRRIDSVGGRPAAKQADGASTETEAVLILQQDMENVLRKIAGLHSIGDYLLRPKATKTIHDTYFDSNDETLRRRGANLRIRDVDGVHVISVKSNTKMSRGVIRRSEIEVPWSDEAVRGVVDGLKVPTRPVSTSRSDANPRDTLIQMGLEIIQDRQTTREIREIVSRFGLEDTVLAELALDRVAYHYQDDVIAIFEVEVEAKTKDSSVILSVTDKLIGGYQPKLKKWAYGKFVTGDAIGKLLQSGELRGYMEGNQLKASAFGMIERFIRSNY